MRPLPTRCPITGGPLVVTRVYSPEGDITIEGRFQVDSPFLELSPGQIKFVLALIQCEGKFNRMQDELKLSYPTLRARLQEIIQVLGLKLSDKPDNLPDDKERLRILAQVDEGKMDVASALGSLQGN